MPMFPIVACPDCGRRVKVAPATERIQRHHRPTGGWCVAAGRQVDLYGVGEVK
jgi:endogenous inhibitor of DNA gyrase (YacG/DUF329 family)